MKRNTIIILFLLATISSCTVYKELPIEVYKPGVVTVPPNAENVALVYRNFKYRADTLQHYYKDDNQLKRAKNDYEQLDSVLANYCLTVLASNLKSKNTFNNIHIFPGVFKAHSGNKLLPLPFDVVKKLTSSSETNLLISLETFSYFYSEYSSDYKIPKAREVITASVWAVYDPKVEKVIERKTMIDTVFWNSYDDKGNYVKNTKLPPRPMALKIASQLAGENYAKRYSSFWQTVNRIYAIPHQPDFEKASTLISKGKWDEAIEIWNRYASEENNKTAINARYNLALAYEVKDEILTAWKWLTAAQQLAEKLKSKEDLEKILQYQKVLVKRKKEIDRLNQS